MNSCICKRFFSGFAMLLFLCLMVMVQEVKSNPILKIDTNNGKTFVETEFGVKNGNLGIFEAIEVIAPTSNPHPYKASVIDDEYLTATADVKVNEKTQVLFTYNSKSKALSVRSLPMTVPEPSTMILFSSLLFIGFVGLKKGKKQS